MYRNVEDEGYYIGTNEAGLHLSLGNNLSADIALYDAEVARQYQMDKHYFKIPPKIVIEVDVAIELENMADIGYIN